tara:strand:- start:401 stop:811 length:411 start_codon:yes stop_codon:yes gene_type:complete
MKITKLELEKIIKEEIQSIAEKHGGEGSMVKNQLNRLSQMVDELDQMVNDYDNHEEWVESKITKAHDYVNSVLNYLSGSEQDLEPMDEGVENINPENLEIVMKAVQHFATQPAVLAALATGGLVAAIAKIKDLMES